jgi:predicted nucleotidyltransferase component of viral defense system
MNLFDRLVAGAMQGQNRFAPIQAVVEKELLHHDILREMNEAGLLSRLVFIGGTCLRACYGASRLSEDLNFAGGADFSRGSLASLGKALTASLQDKYGLRVEVEEPVREGGNVDTWKLRIVTRPQSAHLPQQRIHVDICAVPSHDARPMMLTNHYGVDMGTSGLILQAQSREEILADKMIALALRPGRVKNRDLWDLVWLRQQGVTLPMGLMPAKIGEHRRSVNDYVLALQGRMSQLEGMAGMREDFLREMRRFLPADIVRETVENPAFWSFLVAETTFLGRSIVASLQEGRQKPGFRMG